jgi:predicted MFS family arabinose efflux permease
MPWRNTRLRILCAFTLVGVTAQFASYTYIVPVVRDIAGIHGELQAAVLAAHGIAGLLTMTMLARAIDHRPRAAATGALAALCLAFWFLSALTFTGTGALGATLGIAAVIVWGASAAALPPMLQSAAIRTSPDQPEQASAWYVSAFQVGILTGSIAGGVVYAHFGVAIVVATSSVLFGIALGGVLNRGDVLGSPIRADSKLTGIDESRMRAKIPVNVPAARQ